MLTLNGRAHTLCDRLPRREWLRVGGLSALGFSLPQLLASRSEACVHTSNIPQSLQASFGKAKSVIVLFMLGGPPQHETWDPKPGAPLEVRGDLQSIPTATPGLHVGELMPRTAALTNRIAVLRGMATDDNAHSSSGYWMLTGYPHAPKNQENNPPGAPNDWPCAASVVRKLRGDSGSLPGSIRLPEEIWNTGRILWPGQEAGWLGKSADPWLITCDPNLPNFQVAHLALPSDVDPQRLLARKELQHRLNAEWNAGNQSRSIDSWKTWRRKAIDLLQTSQAQRAFAIDLEPDSVRDRYGRNRFGQSVLLARRLVEAGVSLVQVNWTRWEEDESVAPAWDTHAKNSERLRKALMPPMDLAYSALLEDLEQRGLLDETLVVWMGEFGRSPKINRNGGRDHWGHVFSVALAGGGVQGGAVYGESDRQGGFPIAGRVEPQDLTATLFHCLGFAPQTEIRDPLNRPLAISKGHPIEAIL